MQDFANSVIDLLSDWGIEVKIGSAPSDETQPTVLHFVNRPFNLVLHEVYPASSQDQVSEAALQDCPGSRQIHLWEDVWMSKREIVASMLRSLFGLSQKIHARQTRVEALTNTELLQFLEQNHLQVPIKARTKYGLIWRDQLVAVASFSQARIVRREGVEYKSFELLRFCNLKGCTVVGGISKLLQYFIRKHQPDDIMTYIDNDWSYGESFKRLGFEKAGVLPPMEFWLNSETGCREYPHRVLGKDRVMDAVSLTGSVPDGYSSVWNSGSTKFILKIK